VPLAWPQIPWLLGFALFFVTNILAVLRVALCIVRGDHAAVVEIAGAATQDEEIQSEIKSLGISTPSRSA